MSESQAEARYLQGVFQLTFSPLILTILQSASGTPSMDLRSTSSLVLQINSQCTPSMLPLPTGRRMQRHLSSYAYTRYVDRGP